jgi:hypothetical protein
MADNTLSDIGKHLKNFYIDQFIKGDMKHTLENSEQTARVLHKLWNTILKKAIVSLSEKNKNIVIFSFVFIGLRANIIYNALKKISILTIDKIDPLEERPYDQYRLSSSLLLDCDPGLSLKDISDALQIDESETIIVHPWDIRWFNSISQPTLSVDTIFKEPNKFVPLLPNKPPERFLCQFEEYNKLVVFKLKGRELIPIICRHRHMLEVVRLIFDTIITYEDKIGQTQLKNFSDIQFYYLIFKNQVINPR